MPIAVLQRLDLVAHGGARYAELVSRQDGKSPILQRLRKRSGHEGVEGRGGTIVFTW